MAKLRLLFMLLFISLAWTCRAESRKHSRHVKLQDNIILKFVASGFHKNCSFKLYHDNVVFNNNGSAVINSRNNLTTEQYRLPEVEGEHIFGHLEVRLEIISATFSDEGHYRCSFVCPDSEIHQSYFLKVLYPPGPANCSWVEDKSLLLVQHATLNERDVLRCSASSGFPKSNIICYADQSEGTQLYAPVQMWGRHQLHALFAIRRHFSNVACCSVSEKYHKKQDICQDFISTGQGKDIPDISEKEKDISTSLSANFELSSERIITSFSSASSTLYTTVVVMCEHLLVASFVTANRLFNAVFY